MDLKALWDMRIPGTTIRMYRMVEWLLQGGKDLKGFCEEYPMVDSGEAYNARIVVLEQWQEFLKLRDILEQENRESEERKMAKIKNWPIDAQWNRSEV